ncbi:tetratricopeptide repeat protein [Formosa sp. L2A11]|uniref:tetratricopeptide repeat protein n=1 Tax=Formosa sp. L2A11 TaxID=2686363 RepID=UPI001E2F17C3|nr:tetratricopeptide repeat protein [Formosa sp. L2A11]
MKNIKFTILTLTIAVFFTAISCKDNAANSSQIKANTSESIKTEDSTPEISKTEDNAPEQNEGDATFYFESGLKAIEANNMPLAFKDFLASAKNGHDFAQYNVALMYEQGLGIDKDLKQSFYWYSQSAEQGNSAAQFNLGVSYENGLGTTVDFKKANQWYRKAAVQGDGLAIGNLGMLYMRGDGVKVNKVASIALLIMSIKMDNSPENQAKNNISAMPGLTPEMITEAQTLSTEMSNSKNILLPLDQFLKK